MKIHGYKTLASLAQYRAETIADSNVYSFLENGEQLQQTLTYAQLDMRAKAIAVFLKHQCGISHGDRVALLFCPGLEFLEALYACFYAGVIAVPVYPPGSDASWKNYFAILENANVKVILTDQAKANMLGLYLARPDKPEYAKLGCPAITTHEIDSGLAQHYKQPFLLPTDIAMLQYTSGTTSVPKGVMLSHDNILQNLQRIKEQVSQDYKIGVSWLPLYHDMGMFGAALQALYVGGHCLFMEPSAFLIKPSRWLKAISDYKANISGAPNFAFDLCVDAIDDAELSNIDLSAWQVAASGAEPIQIQTLQRFSDRFARLGFKASSFVPCYGLAESTLLVTADKPDKNAPPNCIYIDSERALQGEVMIVDASTSSKGLVSCGRVNEQQVNIVNPETLQPVIPGAIGEICLRSESVAKGYWNDPKKTFEAFNLRINNKDGFYRSGDMGFIHNGELYISGRIKEMIIIRGKNYFPQDIEQSLTGLHQLLMPASSAVLGIEVNHEERVVVLQEISRKADALINKSELIQLIIRTVKQKHGINVFAVYLLKEGQIQKTSSGKIKRSVCKNLFLNKAFNVIEHWQTSVMERYIDNDLAQNEPLAISEPADTEQTEKHIQFHFVQSDADIAAWLQQSIASIIGSTELLDVNQSLSDFGLDSVGILRLIGDLEKWLGYSVSPAIAFDYPTIALLSAYLSNKDHIRENHRYNTAGKNLTLNETQLENQHSGPRICIVGAGVAGLTAAYHLVKRGYSNITIYEKEHRVGGKVFTQDIDGEPCEMGQVYIAETYAVIRQLMTELDVEAIIVNPEYIIEEDITVADFYKKMLTAAAITSGDTVDFTLLEQRPDLFEGLPDWLQRHQLLPLPKNIEMLWTSFGYGHLDENIPAFYFVKYFALLEPSNYILKIKGGNQRLWERLAQVLANDYGVSIHLGQAVESISRQAQQVHIKLDGKDSEECFDKLIMAAPISTVTRILDLDSKEAELFSAFKTVDYAINVIERQHLPYEIGHHINDFSQNYYTRAIGKALCYLTPDSTGSFVISAQYNSLFGGESRWSEQELAAQLAADFAPYSTQAIVTRASHRWQYSPILSCEDLAAGILTEIQSRQGKKHSYYIGSYMSFETIEQSAAYAQQLVNSFFPDISEKADSAYSSLLKFMECKNQSELCNEAMQVFPNSRYSMFDAGNGQQLEWFSCGNPSGDLLVLLPPMNGLASAWFSFYQSLSDRFQLLSINYPGYGNSSFNSEYSSLSDIADSVLRLIQQQAPEKSCHVIGWSIGGCIAQIMAYKNPERISQLVLLSSTALFNADNSKRDIELFMQRLDEDFSRHLANVELETLSLAFSAETAGDVSLHYLTETLSFDSRKQLEYISQPSLIIVGADDKITTIADAQRLQRGINEADLKIIEHGGHFLPLQHAESMINLIQQFLSSTQKRYPADETP